MEITHVDYGITGHRTMVTSHGDTYDGIAVSFHVNNTLSTMFYYVDSSEEGNMYFFDDEGDLIIFRQVRDGSNHGIVVWYYKDKSIANIMFFNNGVDITLAVERNVRDIMNISDQEWMDISLKYSISKASILFDKRK